MNNDKTVIMPIATGVKPSDYDTLAREIVDNSEPIVLDGDRAVASILDSAKPIVLESDLAVTSILDSARPMAELGQRANVPLARKLSPFDLATYPIPDDFDPLTAPPLNVDIARPMVDLGQSDFGVRFIDDVIAHPFDRPLDQVIGDLVEPVTVNLPMAEKPSLSELAGYPSVNLPMAEKPTPQEISSYPIPEDFDPVTAPPLIPANFDPVTAPPLDVSAVAQQISSPGIPLSEASIKSLLSGGAQRDLDKDEPTL